MSELTAQALAAQGAEPMFVANRPAASAARELRSASAGRVAGFDDPAARSGATDIVVAATSSPHPIVGHDELALVMRARDERPLLLIDIAVPRDVDPLCAQLAGVRLFDIDDLQADVERNRGARAAEARRAEVVIEEEIQRFAEWLGSLEVLPTIAALRAHGRRDRRRGAGGERPTLGVAIRARPRADRGDRAHGRQPPAARSPHCR